MHEEIGEKISATYDAVRLTSERTLELLEKQRGDVRESAAIMLLGLLTSDVPFEEMFSKHAVASGEFLRCDLAASKYVGSEPIYNIAEHVLYRFSSNRPQVATIYPLIRSEQPFLIAAFPTSNEQDILPILRAHIPEIEAAFRDQKSRARQLLTKIKRVARSNLPISQIFEAIGALGRGLLGN